MLLYFYIFFFSAYIYQVEYELLIKWLLSYSILDTFNALFEALLEANHQLSPTPRPHCLGDLQAPPSPISIPTIFPAQRRHQATGIMIDFAVLHLR